MSFTNIKNDDSYLEHHSKSNKTILDYVTNPNQFINKNECNDYTPAFLTYLPVGVPQFNVDIENELRGAFRQNSRCISNKFQPKNDIIYSDMGNEQDVFQQQEKLDIYPNNKKECDPSFRILPEGYVKRK